MNSKTKDLTFMAMYLALFYVLDVIANQLAIFKMPQGGSLGLGVIALLLASYHLGWKKGLAVSLLSVLLQFMTGQMYFVSFAQFILEYFLAFGIYGLSSLLPNISYFYSGIVVTNLLRLALHTVAGVLYWETEWWASFTYNAWYMIPTMIVCLIVVPLICSRIKTVKN
ncbi:MAG: energy-coupled thiamine transporter ThiT [Erysipelotrichaceae bacterium]|nr:energy-coupled thiamine transporter ThiT [Erysipelotrichaceae bacterium]